jgi:hypothetical protein
MTHKKVDASQAVIVEAFTTIGATVLNLHSLGVKGAPDVLIGLYGRNWLFEIKTPERAKEHKAHREEQAAWRVKWHGQAHQVETFTQALEIIKSEMEDTE